MNAFESTARPSATPNSAPCTSASSALPNSCCSAGKLPWHPSFFEMLTVMAFEYFASVGVEIAVLEVGMGGRLDATNVVEPADLSDRRHLARSSEVSGRHHRRDRGEKAGIIRENGVVVTLPQHPAGQRRDRARHSRAQRPRSQRRAVRSAGVAGSREYLAGRVLSARGRNRYPLTVMGEEIEVDSPLAGRHQLRNVALAIATAEELASSDSKSTPKQIEQGIRETHWPGRFQVLPPSPATHQREMVLDVAHNPAGAWALRSALSETFPGRELTLVFAAMRRQGDSGDGRDSLSSGRAGRGDSGRQSARSDDRRIAAGRHREPEMHCDRGDRRSSTGARARAEHAGRSDRRDRLHLSGRRSHDRDGNATVNAMNTQAREMARSEHRSGTLLTRLRSYFLYVPLVYLYTRSWASCRCSRRSSTVAAVCSTGSRACGRA